MVDVIQCRRSAAGESLLDDDGMTLWGDVRSSDRIDALGGAASYWTEVDDENLVVVVVDERVQGRDHLDPLTGGKVAAEYGVLDVITESAHGFVDLTASPVIGNVVRNDVSV